MKKYLPYIIIAVLTVFFVLGVEMMLFAFVGKEKLAKLPVLKQAFVLPAEKIKYIEKDDPKYSELETMVEEYQKKMESIPVIDKRQKELDTYEREINEQEQALKRLQAEIDQQLIIIAQTRWNNLTTLAEKFSKMEDSAVAGVFENFDDERFAGLLLAMENKKASAVMQAYVNKGNSDKENEKNAKRIAEIYVLMERMTQEQSGQ